MEIWMVIVRYLANAKVKDHLDHHPPPKDHVLVLSMTCRFLRNVCLPSLFRTVDLPNLSVQDLLAFSKAKHILKNVKQVNIALDHLYEERDIQHEDLRFRILVDGILLNMTQIRSLSLKSYSDCCPALHSTLRDFIYRPNGLKRLSLWKVKVPSSPTALPNTLSYEEIETGYMGSVPHDIFQASPSLRVFSLSLDTLPIFIRLVENDALAQLSTLNVLFHTFNGAGEEHSSDLRRVPAAFHRLSTLNDFQISGAPPDIDCHDWVSPELFPELRRLQFGPICGPESAIFTLLRNRSIEDLSVDTSSWTEAEFNQAFGEKELQLRSLSGVLSWPFLKSPHGAFRRTIQGCHTLGPLRVWVDHQLEVTTLLSRHLTYVLTNIRFSQPGELHAILLDLPNLRTLDIQVHSKPAGPLKHHQAIPHGKQNVFDVWLMDFAGHIPHLQDVCIRLKGGFPGLSCILLNAWRVGPQEWKTYLTEEQDETLGKSQTTTYNLIEGKRYSIEVFTKDTGGID